MCMKKINVCTEFYESDLSEFCGSIRFGNMIESIKAIEREDKKIYIDGLTIATNICAMSSDDDPELTKTYSIKWTFGKIKNYGNNNESFERFVISEAVFSPFNNRKNKTTNAICRHFSNQLYKFTLSDYEIENSEGKDTEDYYLKVFLKEDSDGKWTLQSMNYIKVIF